MDVVQAEELKFKHPFSMLLTGARRTGKTYFIKTLLREATNFITPQIDKVFWFAPSRQNDLFEVMKAYTIGYSITFVKDLPNEDYGFLEYKSKEFASEILSFLEKK